MLWVSSSRFVSLSLMYCFFIFKPSEADFCDVCACLITFCLTGRMFHKN